MDEPGTRERILLAAAQLFGEDPGSAPSVRAVAARAGISTGSLRHHFPTQRALQEEVLTRIYDHVTPDDVIHDRTLPARDRLVACLRQVLAGAGVGDEARRALRIVVDRFVAPTQTDELREAYRGIEQEGLRRVRYWLTLLVEEGALAPGDNAQRARFLMTVVSGLSLERALPAGEELLAAEHDTLHAAVDAVLASPGAEPSTEPASRGA